MKIWNPFRRDQKSLASPDDWLASLFGVTSTSTGITVSADAALKVPAVSSAIRVISEAAATLDVGIVEIDAKGVERPSPDHPAHGLLKVGPNSWTSAFEFIRDLTASALMRDDGGLAWVNWIGGRPYEAIQMAAGQITFDLDPVTLEPRYRVSGGPIIGNEIIHLRSPFGRAPLSLAREAIATAMALDGHAGKLFSRGARPSGALKFPKGMGEEAVKKARTAWRLTHEGTDAEGRTAILYDGAEFEPFTFNSTDAQFIENRSFQILEVARAFRVPPTMLFELDRATWSNTEQLGREFLVYCLEPWLHALEGALGRALFTDEERGRYAVRFDRDDLTRADLNTRATVINSLIAGRVINPNEGRAWLGLAPYAGGDEFMNPNITTPKEAEADAA